MVETDLVVLGDTMSPEELQRVRAELEKDDLIVVSRKFHEAAAEALRWMTKELADRKQTK